MRTILKDAPTSVYTYYDSAGEVLYVGVTARGHQRAQQHERTKPWWPLVASSSVEHFPDRDSALREERRLIHYWRPPHNTQHRPANAAPRRATAQALPIHAYRSLMGRTSRFSSLADIDIDAITHDLTEYRETVRTTYGKSARRNETVSQFRERLKAHMPTERV